MKSLVHCKEVSIRITREIVNNDRLHKIMVRASIAKKIDNGILYVTEVIKMFRMEINSVKRSIPCSVLSTTHFQGLFLEA